ncbi:MAG: transglutaminase-like domain-containing protein [Anaerolineales bacterium]|jgi:transglutaminase-like putative cysteine protease
MNRALARLWDFPSAAILILLLLTTSEGLVTTQWAPGLGTAVVLAVIGVVLGLALGFSQFKRTAIFWFSIGFSIPIILLVLGWSLYAGISWLERLADLSGRLASSLGLFIKSQPVHDTALFVVFMALVFWIIALMAGFALTRFGNFIAAVVPAGAVLVTVHLYDAGNKGGNLLLAFYFLLCLLELGRMTYVQRRRFWKEHNVSVLAESRTDLNITLAIASVILVLLVWLAPTSLQSFSNIKTAWDNLTRPFHNVQENLGHAVAGLHAAGKLQPVEFYGDALALGSQAATGDTVYFRIQVPTGEAEYAHGPASLSYSVPRYYWRVRSYNFFLNDQWYTRDASNTPFQPGGKPIPLAVTEKLTGEFAFTSLVANLAVLITPAGPVWVSHPSELVALPVPQGKMDPVEFLSEPPVMSGEVYLVHANVSGPTILQLRNAGDTYPDWVTAENLQLPGNLSPEIVALAHRISAQARTPYDKADAITQYLRSNITYSTTVGNPPPGQDSLDWFLFDSKKGFCNYYATAEVILLRSVGIPARMVVGFAQGGFSPPNLYVVREQDEHAWPEGYFPGIGWVEFEPTSNQASIVRPPGGNLSSTGQGSNATPPFLPGQIVAGRPTPIPAGEAGTNSGPGTFLNWLLGLIFICAILVTILRINSFGLFDEIPSDDQGIARWSLPLALKHFAETQGLTPPDWLSRWTYLAALNPIERSFITVYTSLHWLGVQTTPPQTPAEAAAILAERLPRVSKEIDALLNEYQRQLYSRIHGRLYPARSAAKAIRREAMRAAFQQRWRRFGGIFGLGRQ